MGYLWANMEKIDVQASEAALTAAENRAQAAEAELSDTKEKLIAAENRAQNAENRAQEAEAENTRLKAMLAAQGIEMLEN